MWGIIRTILTSPFGSFAFVFAMLCLCFWAIYKVTKATTEWNEKQKGIDKLESRVDKISEDLQYIKVTLDVMKNNPPENSLIQSHSPVSLTQIGKDVAAKMGASSYIASNWERIFDCIEKANIGTSAYDIQQFCIETATISLEKFFSPEDVAKIKEFAYNEGKTIAYYGGMFGVLIRDKYFEAKGIPIEEVDRSAPRRQ